MDTTTGSNKADCLKCIHECWNIYSLQSVDSMSLFDFFTVFYLSKCTFKKEKLMTKASTIWSVLFQPWEMKWRGSKILFRTSIALKNPTNDFLGTDIQRFNFSVSLSFQGLSLLPWDVWYTMAGNFLRWRETELCDPAVIATDFNLLWFSLTWG